MAVFQLALSAVTKSRPPEGGKHTDAVLLGDWSVAKAPKRGRAPRARSVGDFALRALSWRPTMLLLTGLSCSLLLQPSARRSARPRMQAEAAAEVVGVSFEEAYSDRLPEWLITRAAELGYTNPTPVQQETLDTVLDGHDAIVQAKTGSGKTLAYLLPILASLKPTSSVQALVLLPTRELATQVARAARQLAAGSPDRLLVMALMDGSGAKRQRKWLVAEPPQVIVANVQQAESVLRAGLLRMGGLRMLVVDEVDECVSTDATRALLHGLLSTQLRVPQSAAAGARPSCTLTLAPTLTLALTLPLTPTLTRCAAALASTAATRGGAGAAAGAAGR